MGKLKFSSIFSSILAIVMVLSLLSPMSAAANYEQSNKFKQQSLDESTLALKAAIFEQQELSEKYPKLHSNLQNLSGSEEVAVIIHLSENPVALEMGLSQLKGTTLSSSQKASIKQKVQQQQNTVTKEMTTKGITFKKGFSYDTVLNGFAASVKAEDVAKLLNIKGVTLVEPDTIVYASSEEDVQSSPFTNKGEVEAAMNTSIDFLGIEKLWEEGYEGQGISVAVLDTGIDADHPEFAGIYKGGKNFIPHSSTYTEPRADDDASETSPLERPPGVPEFNANGSSFYTSHGTHVAGTIAAIGANEYGIKGIAPKVDLYAYRVLGAYGSGSNSGIIAAIDYAVEQDIDIINLSLGGGSNTETDSGSYAINNAMMAGTISVIATGNSGPKRGTMGSPATARLGIAVGNSTNPETKYDGEVNISVGTYEYSEQLDLMATTFGQDLATQLNGEYEIVAIPGVGNASDFKGIDVNGKVALISRGSILFVDKIANAKANGAVATIIHNNAGAINAPNASGTYLSDSFDYIPTFDMSQTDGDAIRLALENGAGTVTFGNFGSFTTLGDEVNDSSSRGPSTPNFDIKPDVTAPGTNIMSTIPMYKADFPEAEYDQAYDRKTGTSMATPHITGIVALILQANPDWTPFDVKVALSNTAKVLNVAKYDVFAQGAGRVDAYAAAHPTILATAIDTAVLDASGEIVENLKGTVTFGPQKLEEDITVTKEILVKDYSGKGGSVSVTVTPTKEFGDATLTIDNPTFTLEPNGEQLIKVTLTASKAETQIGDEFLGYIEIESGDNSISLPFAADFGGADPLEIKDVYIDNTDLSFNGDGINDSANVFWTNTGDLGFTLIEIWDYMNPDGGVFRDGYIGYIDGGDTIPAGSWRLPITGAYLNYETNKVELIPDGLYTIDINDYENSLFGYTEPVFVKSTKPEIDGSVSDGKLVGQVTDKYIEFIEELNNNWYFDYDLNTKLSASYVIGLDGEPTPFELNQDGSFELEIGAENVNKQITITVEDAAGNISDPFVLNAIDDEVTLSVDPESLDLTTGETEQLTVTEITTPAEGDATERDVTAEATYVVADESVVTVSGGLVTAVGEGTTTITITHGEEEVTVTVTVTAPVVVEPAPDVTLSVSPTSLDLTTGETEQLTVTEITTPAEGDATERDVTAEATYVVANESVATVSGGLVTAIGEGTTTITITHGKEEVTVTVTVSDPIVVEPEPDVTLSVSPTSLDLTTGETEQLTVTEITTPAEGDATERDVTAEATYVVANESVATVSGGLVTAVGEGTTTITITLGEEEVTVNVTVTDPIVVEPEPDVTLSVSPTSLDLTTGETEQLTVTETTTPAEGEPTSKDVTEEASYSVEDSSIATVSEKGLVTAKNAGETTITVTYGEDTVTVNVKVTAAPTVPSTPSTPSPSTPSGEVNVDANTITNQVKDTTKGEVKVELPALSVTQPKVSAKIQSSSVKEIAESSKPLVLTSGKIEVTVPNSVLKAIAANSPDSVTISVGSSKSTDINGAVSEIYEFTITTVKNGKSETFSVFSEPVTVTVPVADTIKDSRKVAAYYINESTNSLDYVGGKYNNGKLTFNTNHFSKFVVIESNLSFGDITNHWAKDAIEVLASRKITSGKTNATFNPEHSLTRAEFATLLVRALNIPTSSYEGIFPDVTEEQRWSVLHIEAAYRAGLVYGDLKGQFNPQNKLTREQMATMIVRAIEYKNASLLEVTTTASKFADETNISLYAKNAVQQAATLKIIKGIGNNKFAPLQITTRAEAAVMLYKLLELLEEI